MTYKINFTQAKQKQKDIFFGNSDDNVMIYMCFEQYMSTVFYFRTSLQKKYITCKKCLKWRNIEGDVCLAAVYSIYGINVFKK